MYEDIINLSHPISKKHPQMSIASRAAQFAPYSALTGYNDEIKETARLTNAEIELNEDEKSILNSKIQNIIHQLHKHLLVSITFFEKDLKKDGGNYITSIDIIKKFDKSKKNFLMENNLEIPIKNIINIDILH